MNKLKQAFKLFREWLDEEDEEPAHTEQTTEVRDEDTNTETESEKHNIDEIAKETDESKAEEPPVEDEEDENAMHY